MRIPSPPKIPFSEQKAPVAFFYYRRLECSIRVMQMIRSYRPSILLLVADGPKSGDAEGAMECETVRSAIEGLIDWNCDVRRLYSDENLGCKNRLSSGLDWVFREVDQAIILEDDCLPGSSFFSFCNALLSGFRDVEEVMHIGGTSPLSSSRHSNSFRFSRYNRIWGWANWSRSWRHFDKDISFWPEYRDSGALDQLFSSKEASFWSKLFDRVYAGGIDTWDYQWFLCRLRRGLAVEPSVNLVSNIGFGSMGTHTTRNSHPLARMQTGEFQFPAVGPSFVEADAASDADWSNHVRREGSVWSRILRHWRKML